MKMMQEIPCSTANLPALFDAAIPNHPILFSALEGHIKNVVLADAEEQPKQAAVRTPDGFIFFSAAASEDFLRSALRRLQLIGPAITVLAGDVRRFPKPDLELPRFEFTDLDQESSGIGKDKIELPAGFSLQKMDSGLLASCEWRGLIELSYGSVERFLAESFGFCLMEGEKVVTEAYAAFQGGGAVEIGVITADSRQGRGFGGITSARLIQEIEAQGLSAYWSCDQSNTPSVSLARKLGFKTERKYDLYGYRPLKAPA